ncbi:MAG: replication initiation and rane attachment protein DnaB/DnaD family [Bacilli bacterium]|nr:replication initiation and rane attachment protein DnaB/DnaD family [Bacilli bacterium]
MRITNLHHFTENHRFCIYRDFSLSGLDYRMLSSIYQPMIGAFAISLYMTLYQQLSSEKVGFSPLEQQRKLFFSLELEHGERGRKFFVEQSSKLEAVGLLQTTRRFIESNDDYIYEYQLTQPLAPQEFFKNQHLILLLRDKVGKHMVLFLHEDLVAEEPDEIKQTNSENLSVPFYELFKLNTQVIDYELEQALYQTAASRQSDGKLDVTTKGFAYEDIIMRFPRESRNRAFVENIRFRPDQLAAVNIVAKKYHLTLQETCRLLDEDTVFDDEGNLLVDLLQYKANLFYRQVKKREESQDRHVQKMDEQGRTEEDEMQEEKSVEMAFYLDVPTVFQGQCDVHQYNMLLRNEPYTLVLKRFFSQGSVPDGVLDIFEKIDLNYKLHEEVINVLIHFIHADRRSWAKSSIEAVASDLLGKQIITYEQAVGYVRDKAKYREQAAARSTTGADRGAYSKTRNANAGKQKPKISIIADGPVSKPLSNEQIEAIRQRARKLDGKI